MNRRRSRSLSTLKGNTSKQARCKELDQDLLSQMAPLWKEKGLKSWATMQPNWLGAFATYVAVQALEGKDVPAFIKIPLPVIDNSNIDEYLARAPDFPADGYIYSPFDQALFEKLLAGK